MDEKLNVYIWDMDETLILLKSLINETYAKAFNGSKDVQKGVEIGKVWENQILQVCDDHFFYEQIESCNKPFLDALKQYDDGRDLTDYDFDKDSFTPSNDDASQRKLAYRHRVIADKYKKGLHGIFDKEMLKFLDNLYDATDSYTDNWFSSARACVDECSGGKKEPGSLIDSTHSTSGTTTTSTKYKHVNILVTSGSLIPSLVKCLLFRVDDLISQENDLELVLTDPYSIFDIVRYRGSLLSIYNHSEFFYSSWDVGKLQCFSWIKERFSGPNVQFCVIGDGWEECEAAQSMRWPFVQVEFQPGSVHRFPGLSTRTLGHYLSVIYGDTDDERIEQKSSP